MASGSSRPVRVDALAQPGDRASAARRVPPSPSGPASATSRRIELVPQSMAATRSRHRSAPDVGDRRSPVAARAGRRPSGRPGRRRRPGTRRSGRAGTSRPAGCRPTPPDGRGPVVVGGQRPRRARRRSARGRRRARRGRPRPRPAARRRSDSSRPTADRTLGIDQPVAGRHGRAVVEERLVADHHRGAVVVAHDDLEVALGRPAEQPRDLGPVRRATAARRRPGRAARRERRRRRRRPSTTSTTATRRAAAPARLSDRRPGRVEQVDGRRPRATSMRADDRARRPLADRRSWSTVASTACGRVDAASAASSTAAPGAAPRRRWWPATREVDRPPRRASSSASTVASRLSTNWSSSLALTSAITPRPNWATLPVTVRSVIDADVGDVAAARSAAAVMTAEALPGPRVSRPVGLEHGAVGGVVLLDDDAPGPCTGR